MFRWLKRKRPQWAKIPVFLEQPKMSDKFFHLYLTAVNALLIRGTPARNVAEEAMGVAQRCHAALYPPADQDPDPPPKPAEIDAT